MTWQPAVDRPERIAWAGLLIFAAISHFTLLGDRVLSYDEAVHAFYSLRLAETGSYVHSPVTHGPLLFYLNAIVFILLPATDATARLVPALAGTALVGVPWFFRRWIGPAAALAAGGLIAASPLLLYFGRYLRNDIYILLLLSLWIFSVFRFLETPGRGWLYALTIAVALSFSCKEVSFISATVITSFLFLIAGLRWRTASLPALQLSVQHVTLILPLSVPLALRLIGLESVRIWLETHPRWAFGSTACGILISALIAYATSGPIGRRGGILTFRNWLKSAVLFWLILGFYFTTFLKNPPGLFTGFFQSLNYWLGQHAVGRGDQPAYYYLLILGLYEFVILIPGLAALGTLLLKASRLGRHDRFAELFGSPEARFRAFCAWWAIGNLVIYSVAGERMPWLAIHILFPFVFLAADLFPVWIERIFAARATLVKAIPLVLLAGVLIVLGLRTSIRLNYINGGLPVEPAAYAQGGPRVPELGNRIRSAVAEGREVAIDNRVAWPLMWYLRGLESGVEQGNFDDDPVGKFDVVIVDRAFPSAQPEETDRYVMLWWPIRDYKSFYSPGPGIHSFRDELVTFWQVFYNRHFQGLEVDSWPQRRDAWLYDRSSIRRHHLVAPSD